MLMKVVIFQLSVIHIQLVFILFAILRKRM
jgi:hypothetical protein